MAFEDFKRKRENDEKVSFRETHSDDGHELANDKLPRIQAADYPSYRASSVIKPGNAENIPHSGATSLARRSYTPARTPTEEYQNEIELPHKTH